MQPRSRLKRVFALGGTYGVVSEEVVAAVAGLGVGLGAVCAEIAMAVAKNNSPDIKVALTKRTLPCSNALI